jgi:hypothetical protein
MVVLSVRALSAAITFRRGDLLSAYSRMGWKQSQLEAMSSSATFRSGAFLWWGFAFILLFLGYLLWTKRYFTVRQPEFVPHDSPGLGNPESGASLE